MPTTGLRPTLRWSLSFALLLLTPAQGQQTAIQLSSVATGIVAPTDIQNAGDGSGRLFLVQQGGQIRLLLNGQVAATPFLDISTRISAGGERGLLGMAFPPDFTHKQYF